MGEIRTGYKKTDIGMVPQEWKVNHLSLITDPKRPISYGIVQTGPNLLGGVNCLRVVDVVDGKINTENMICTSRSISNSYKRTILQVNDLVMPLRGKVGDVAIVADSMAGWNLTRGVALIAVQPEWSARYCRQYISSTFTRARLVQAMNGSALQEIPIAALRSFEVALPPTKAEQEAIAEALSDADALIETLEQLVAKKRHLKQGTMQELLTGKKRLPGFSKDWDHKQFGEIVALRKVRVNPLQNRPEEFCIELEHIAPSSGTLLGSSATNESFSLKSVFFEGDVLFGKLRAYLRKYWHADRDGVCSTEIWVFYTQDNLLSAYLFQLIQTDSFIEAATNSYGTHMPRSDWNVIKKYQLVIPCEIAEQTSITMVLSDMDTEITNLETQLTKTRAIKQGMMNKLLTGEIRLI